MKDTTFKIRISTDDKEAIRKAAEKAGMTMTEYVMSKVLGEKENEK